MGSTGFGTHYLDAQTRNAFEARLNALGIELANAVTEAQVEAAMAQFALEFQAFQAAHLWGSEAEMMKDMDRAQKMGLARLSSLKGFLGQSITTWLLIGAGALAGWYFWNKSKKTPTSAMTGYHLARR